MEMKTSLKLFPKKVFGEQSVLNIQLYRTIFSVKDYILPFNILINMKQNKDKQLF